MVGAEQEDSYVNLIAVILTLSENVISTNELAAIVELGTITIESQVPDVVNFPSFVPALVAVAEIAS
ncbi:MAG: hypothetical protein IJP79_05950 [Paludibacteraceae bacterium]|nr:hypothetical protein [Paludibacteraceae bacterium]